MNEPRGDRAIASVPGSLALCAWTVYVLLAVLQLPDVFPSVLIPGAVGFLACVAVVLNFRHWRFALLLASIVYLLFYVVRVARMATIGADAEKSSLLSGVFYYYATSWQLAAAMFQERVIGGLTHAFLEYLMPVLIVVLIGATLLSRRPPR